MPLSDAARELCSDLFTKLDKNNDGVLNAAEQTTATKMMHSFVPPSSRWKWVEMDADGDGNISLSEWLMYRIFCFHVQCIQLAVLKTSHALAWLSTPLHN